jgi:hypothetical protein
LSTDELLPIYYTRQVAESTFGFSKSKLNLLPLRVHTTENLRGYTFLSYLALLLSVEIQQKLEGLCTLQYAVAVGHNHLCEIFDGDIVPLEPSKRLKDICCKLGLVVVNSSGD